MSNILLINSIIREFAPPNNIPLGVCYLSSVLKQAGHNVDICDLNGLRQINPDREYWLSQYKRKYDFIGLSGLIVTYGEQRRYLDYITEHKREFGNPVIITGGGLASSVPVFAHRNMLEIDIYAMGEGEHTILDIVNGKEWGSISGIAYNYDFGRELRFNKSRELIKDLDKIPYPDWESIPVDKVYLKNPIWGGLAGNSSKIPYLAKRSMNMIVSRGCPNSCSFCYHYVFGKKYRLRSVANVIGEIMELKNRFDIDFVGFVDDNTTANRAWVLDFCNQMIEKFNGDIKWGCSARVNQVDKEVLEAMKSAGCEWIGFGIESGSPEILQRMNKKATPEMASKAIKLTREAGIWANTTFIAGYLGETKETLRQSARFMKENDCLNSMFYANPYPETQLYEEAKDKIIDKYGSEDSYIKSLADATELKVNLSQLSDQDLVKYRNLAMSGQEF